MHQLTKEPGRLRSFDGTVLDTVSDGETFTTELSSTIFSKMAQLNRLDRD